jgi:hypothetical protein
MPAHRSHTRLQENQPLVEARLWRGMLSQHSTVPGKGGFKPPVIPGTSAVQIALFHQVAWSDRSGLTRLIDIDRFDLGEELPCGFALLS